MRVPPDARLTSAPGVLTRTVGDELVLLDLDTELYFGLDPVGAVMWQTICDQGTLAGAHSVLVTKYDVAPEQLQDDLDELVDNLLERNLLQLHDA